jgi:hypothetical protein
MSLFKRLYRVSTAGTSLTCGGLDGDRHGLYEVTYYLYLATPGSTASITMQPNGDASNLEGERSSDFGAPGNATNWQLGVHTTSGSDDNVFIGKAKVFAARTLGGTSVHRGYVAETYSKLDSVGGTDNFRNVGGIYLSSASNLTSLVFTSSSNMAVGSYALIEQVTADNVLL